ncbi:MAG: N-acetylmuramoyl-L-alanine amidase, partial [Myxococcales bacterium]|nr:N-acetylmuramoyl-L-alanine amidase [Myxococcales bacterium]
MKRVLQTMLWLGAAAFATGCATSEDEPEHGPHGHDDTIYPATPVDTPVPLKNAEYPRARYLQARFYTPGRSRAIDMVVIHTTEGSYNSARDWFRNPNNQYKTSAHYVIRSSDGEITQMVRESDTAHHVRNYNSHSIGIEHEAFVDERRYYTDAMYQSSAALVRYLCQKYNIPMDRAHIRGHNELDPARRSDPGRYWDWDRFMAMVNNGAAPPPAAPPQADNPNEGGGVPGAQACNLQHWNCTDDRQSRYRCAGGVVAQTERCGAGCQVMPIGQDDQCRPEAGDGGGWGACTANGQPGTCMDVAQCRGETTANPCPAGNNIQCRTSPRPAEPAQPDPAPSLNGRACSVAGVAGACLDVADGNACRAPASLVYA